MQPVLNPKSYDGARVLEASYYNLDSVTNWYLDKEGEKNADLLVAYRRLGWLEEKKEKKKGTATVNMGMEWESRDWVYEKLASEEVMLVASTPPEHQDAGTIHNTPEHASERGRGKRKGTA